MLWKKLFPCVLSLRSVQCTAVHRGNLHMWSPSHCKSPVEGKAGGEWCLAYPAAFQKTKNRLELLDASLISWYLLMWVRALPGKCGGVKGFFLSRKDVSVTVRRKTIICAKVSKQFYEIGLKITIMKAHVPNRNNVNTIERFRLLMTLGNE